jgi:hypothetical protein
LSRVVYVQHLPGCNLLSRQRNGKTPTISGFIEAMILVAIRCQDCDFVAARLQSHGGIDDQAFGASNPKIRMHEDDVSLARRLRHAGTRISVQFR